MDGAGRTQPAHTFELSGGALCLDFANTWEDRERPEEEHLQGYADLLRFALQTEVVAQEEAVALERQAAKRKTVGKKAGKPPDKSPVRPSRVWVAREVDGRIEKVIELHRH